MIVINAVRVGEDVLLDVAVREGVSTAVGVDKPVIVLVAEGLDVSLDVRDGLAPIESGGEEDGELLAVSEGSGKLLAVLEVVDVTVSEPDEEAVCVTVADGVLVGLTVAVALEESEMLGVIDAEAPIERELVGVLEITLESDVVELGVCDDVEVPVPVGDLVPLTDSLAVEVDESVPLSEPDKEGPAPFVTLAVGERVTDFVIDVVELGVCDEVLVPLPVGEPVPLTDSLAVEDDESVPLSLPVNDGPAPIVTLAVGECEMDLDKLIVVVGVVLDVGVPVMVSLPVDVPLIETVLGILNVDEGETDAVGSELGVTLADAPIDCVVVGVGVLEAVTVALSDVDALA